MDKTDVDDEPGRIFSFSSIVFTLEKDIFYYNFDPHSLFPPLYFIRSFPSLLIPTPILSPFFITLFSIFL